MSAIGELKKKAKHYLLKKFKWNDASYSRDSSPELPMLFSFNKWNIIIYKIKCTNILD